MARATEVTLYWSLLTPDLGPAAIAAIATIGTVELLTLRQLKGDKVSGPEPVTIAGQAWLKFSIAGGPPGVKVHYLSGVVYVFAVYRNEQAWKIKVRATFRDPRSLADVEELLKHFTHGGPLSTAQSGF